jgi:hypothetical protein
VVSRHPHSPANIAGIDYPTEALQAPVVVTNLDLSGAGRVLWRTDVVRDILQRADTTCARMTENQMTIALSPLIALIAGILILVMPRLLNYIVAFYLIITGLVGLFGSGANFTL